MAEHVDDLDDRRGSVDRPWPAARARRQQLGIQVPRVRARCRRAAGPRRVGDRVDRGDEGEGGHGDRRRPARRPPAAGRRAWPPCRWRRRPRAGRRPRRRTRARSGRRTARPRRRSWSRRTRRGSGASLPPRCGSTSGITAGTARPCGRSPSAAAIRPCGPARPRGPPPASSRAARAARDGSDSSTSTSLAAGRTRSSTVTGSTRRPATAQQASSTSPTETVRPVPSWTSARREVGLPPPDETVDGVGRRR